MKKHLWNLTTFACIGLLCTMLTSCEREKTNTLETKIDIEIPIDIGISKIDSLAGTFKLKNISDSKQKPSNKINATPGDTIKMIFEPKSEYKNKGICFTLSCSGLERLSADNDSMYVVNKATNYGVIKVSLTAMYEDESKTLSATAIAEINIDRPHTDTELKSNSYLTIPYQLILSEDLLLFVTPEISYNDPSGNTQTFLLNYDDMIHSDSVIQSYNDNGAVKYKTYMPNAKYSFKLRYTSLPATTEITVRYIPKDNVKITRDNYDFQHEFDRMSATGILYHYNGDITIISETHFSVTIDFTHPQKQTEQDIRQYIENLSRTPNVKRWSISARGEIEEIKE